VSALPNPLSTAEREALGELYTLHYAQVLRLCRYLLGSAEEAEDAAHEVFLRLPKALETYDSAQPLEPWLSRVTSNYCVDLLRRRQSEHRIFLDVEPREQETAAPAASPYEEFLLKEKGAKVREALAELPEHYRRPLIQRYWGGLGYHEIAHNLGLTRANVATLIFRAKEGLRHALALRANAPQPAEWAWEPSH
jgi:RNA polymerase sigma factor (sigma-70 family)